MNAQPRRSAPNAKLQQPDLFGKASPDGFVYRANIISPTEESALASQLGELPFEPFDFHGHLANRRVMGFGLRYDYASREVKVAPPVPDWLLALRDKVCRFASQPPKAFIQVLINEYRPGAGIGWHKDKPHFGEVVGVSLLAPCTFRFRRKTLQTWERLSITAEPRSAYLLAGPARTVWEHSIPPVDQHRYSITFRTLAVP